MNAAIWHVLCKENNDCLQAATSTFSVSLWERQWLLLVSEIPFSFSLSEAESKQENDDQYEKNQSSGTPDIHVQHRL